MDFNDTPEEAKFRAKCRAWLEENAELKSAETNSTEKMNVGNESVLEKARVWQKKKYDAGWAMLHWPEEFGGIGFSRLRELFGVKKNLNSMYPEEFMKLVLEWRDQY